ncbi:MAG: M3 family metallopeptidase [Muribaculaceae bacterium]|nr:M3 family metallopeptidase [Muribaculaceae bacterium]
MCDSMTPKVFFQPFDTLHTTPPFSKISPETIKEAFEPALKEALDEIEAIADNSEPPTMQNTIVALERSGATLDRVLGIAYPLMDADGNDALDEIAMEMAPKLSEFSTRITLNEALWHRVKAVYDKRDTLNLDCDDAMLLKNTYDSFALSGAELVGEDRERLKQLKSELSELTTRFGQNVTNELKTYRIKLKKSDLEGVPEHLVEEAAQLAKEEGGDDDDCTLTLAQPTYFAFMKSSPRRDLREKMWRLYSGRNTAGEFSNMEIVKRISALRLEIAQLLGAKTFAEHKLRRTMAGTPEAVYDLLDRLKEAYREPQQREMNRLKKFAAALEGQPIDIMPWDYSYYSNKLREKEYAYDEEAMRPYFELSHVTCGVWGLANRLYGITLTENKNIEVYHPDVKAWEVTDADGSYLGVLYTDFFPRPNKRPGAWMTNFKEQWTEADGSDSRPHVSIVMNFTKPVAGKPSLLTPGEVSTFLHEFGHALHGLLTRGRYSSLSGTNVYRDFVELPSQFNENFLHNKEFLSSFARHYETGDALPEAMIDKMIAASRYGAAYACMRQLLFGYLDMAWHTATGEIGDASEFERAAIKDVAMFDDVEGTMVSTQFNHIFSGGYAAGYYSYKWAEVLDADAFSVFEKNGIFDQKTAIRFRKTILERGGSVNPGELYREFRGQEPAIEALLHRDGIK